MYKTLLIDAGNSRIKWATCGAGSVGQAVKLSNHGVAAHVEFLEKKFKAALQQHRPRKIFISNVAGTALAQRIINQIQNCCRAEVEFITTTGEEAGVKNGYRDPQALGVDRWLAMIAAWQQVRGSVCVVDCGTVTTIDVINDKGQHEGGLILPGMEAMQQALFSRTADIAEGWAAADEGMAGMLGRTTWQAFDGGVRHSLKALIQAVRRQYSSQCIPMPLVVTGGSAERLGIIELEGAVCCPDLVLRGLGVFAEIRASSVDNETV